ncbi:hypothetical protein Dda_6168 [Drechslerella dactyloides]|uniref:RRM domain-containing protein n=1 Tax=Drechslerella dactyloides TaxID=74499 RepID=A0AAD6NI81_DREDA|nr:hypothetical protein Dda_6168 [Drechslerella dactyloides]
MSMPPYQQCRIGPLPYQNSGFYPQLVNPQLPPPRLPPPFYLAPPQRQVPLPSPIQSVAATAGSTRLSSTKGPLSPASTVASMSTKTPRRSPVIASTPLAPPLDNGEGADCSSNASEAGSTSSNHSATNVYIGGLPITMTDELLYEMVAPYGEIVSLKAIAERPSGECKGFGFAMFTTAESARACIDGLTENSNYYAKIARRSFYTYLKEKADETSTNLYVSNLPHTWDADKIVAVFHAYEYSTVRLLIKECKFKGVAFIDFKDRAICNEIIEKFNGVKLDEKGHYLKLQVRYADTKEQKELKREAQLVGRFPRKNVLQNHEQAVQRAQQHKVAAGTPTVGFRGHCPSTPSGPYSRTSWRRNEVSFTAPLSPPHSETSNEDKFTVY